MFSKLIAAISSSLGVVLVHCHVVCVSLNQSLTSCDGPSWASKNTLKLAQGGLKLAWASGPVVVSYTADS